MFLYLCMCIYIYIYIYLYMYKYICLYIYIMSVRALFARPVVLLILSYMTSRCIRRMIFQDPNAPSGGAHTAAPPLC